MTYLQAIQYLESFVNYEKIPAWPYKESLKLERFKNFLATIGNPQASLRCIHVAGSKGKGSTCAFLTYILREAGFKVGLYTSPHLSDFRERIRVLRAHRIPQWAMHPSVEECWVRRPLRRHRLLRYNRVPTCNAQRDFEGMIPKNALAGLVRRLQPAIERHRRISPHGPLSFFEVYTALAFLYFKERHVDFAVLETGLGGRLDATNTVSALVSVITPISYEHTQKLGTTLKEIAGEKAGIIKTHSAIVVSAPQAKEAAEVIRARCRKTGVHLYEIGNQIRYARNGRQHLRVRGIFGEYPDLKTRLPGAYQLVNASVAVGAVEALRNYGVTIGIGAMRRGLARTIWPGRCEVVSRNPLVILDGAQNVASCLALKKAVRENFKYEKLILVVGISKDKDMRGVCRVLESVADTVVVTRANNPRATNPARIAKYFKGKTAHITQSTQEALRVALRISGKRDLVLVAGSLFLVGEAREILLVPPAPHQR